MKRFLALSVSALLVCSALTACGGSASTNNAGADAGADAGAAAGASADASASEGDSSDASEAKAEVVASSDDFTFADLQNNYAILVDCYNVVEAAYNDKTIAADEEVNSLLKEAADLIEEIGELDEANFPDQESLVAMNDNFVTIIEGLEGIVDKFELADNGEGEAADGEAADGEGEAADGEAADGEGEAADGEAADGEAVAAGDLDTSVLEEDYKTVLEQYNAVDEAVKNGKVELDEDQTALMLGANEILTKIQDMDPSTLTQEDVDALDEAVVAAAPDVQSVYDAVFAE